MESNTYIEGFFLSQATNNATTTLNEVTSVERGKIIAFDLIADTSLLIDSPVIDFTLGGQEIIKGGYVTNNRVDSGHKIRHSVPLEINSGQTFSSTLNGSKVIIPIAAAIQLQTLFLREGFKGEFKFNRNLNTHSINVNTVPVATAFLALSGVIAKNRGRCVGFTLAWDNRFAPLNLLDITVNFFVDGIQRLKNVPLMLFHFMSTREYRNIFPIDKNSLPSGSTWSLEVTNPGAGLLALSPTFYFEKS